MPCRAPIAKKRRHSERERLAALACYDEAGGDLAQLGCMVLVFGPAFSTFESHPCLASITINIINIMIHKS